MPIEMIILLILASYFIIGTSQIFSALRIKKVASSLKFPKKDFFVSVIIPIKAVLHKVNTREGQQRYLRAVDPNRTDHPSERKKGAQR